MQLMSGFVDGMTTVTITEKIYGETETWKTQETAKG